MKKKITLLLCVVIAIAMFFGACANGTPGPGASPSASASAGSDTVVVGEIDGQPVYKSELESWLNMMGYGADILSDPTYADSFPKILDSFMSVKAMNAEIMKRGYLDNLTSDQISQAEQYAQTDIDTSVQNYGMTEEQVLAQIGLTKDELVEQYKLNIAGNTAFTDLVGNLKPTEDQIKQEYDDTVATQKSAMDADPKVYVSDVNSGTDVYYVPAGVRMVRKLLIAIDSKTADAILTLRESDFNDQADILLNDALSKIKAKAEGAADKIKGGLSFTDAMTQFNEDDNAPEGGYAVVTGTTEYPGTFTEKAMALTSLEQTSDMFATDEGYLIIEYTSDLKAGAVDYASVRDKLSESLLTQVQTDAWTAMIDQWKTDHNIKTFAENL